MRLVRQLLGRLEDAETYDAGTLCISQRKAWEDLVACAASCIDDCQTKIGCAACLGTKCASERDACNAATGP
ncbi:MAG: hypothetical protein R3F14_12995 [Polyangiaceae bacterium]